MCLQPPKQSRRQFVPVCAFNPQKRVYESQKRAYESQKRAYEPHKRREKRENVFISVKILSKILGVFLASALMSLRSAPMCALMSLISAGKNGENVFISAKSSVVSKRAYESHKRAYEPQKRAYESQQRREKREKRVHKRNWNSGEVN